MTLLGHKDRARTTHTHTPNSFINDTRRTHVLETAEGGTCQDTQGKRPTEAHSRSGDGRGRDLSGHVGKPTDRGALTNWRQQREGLVRTRKETDRGALTNWRRQREGLVRTRKESCQVRGAHALKSAERRPGQETRNIRE